MQLNYQNYKKAHVFTFTLYFKWEMQFSHAVRDQMDHARHLPCATCCQYLHVQNFEQNESAMGSNCTLSITFSANLHINFATHATLVNFSFPTVKSKFEQNKYAMSRICNPGVTFCLILHAKSIIRANLVNVSFLCYKISRGTILKPIGMLYNAMSV